MQRIEVILLAVCVPFLLFVAYVLFVLVPVSMYADAKCLRNGYPKSHVTIGLETYCSNLQGTVTVKVDKL